MKKNMKGGLYGSPFLRLLIPAEMQQEMQEMQQEMQQERRFLARFQFSMCILCKHIEHTKRGERDHLVALFQGLVAPLKRGAFFMPFFFCKDGTLWDFLHATIVSKIEAGIGDAGVVGGGIQGSDILWY